MLLSVLFICSSFWRKNCSCQEWEGLWIGNRGQAIRDPQDLSTRSGTVHWPTDPHGLRCLHRPLLLQLPLHLECLKEEVPLILDSLWNWKNSFVCLFLEIYFSLCVSVWVRACEWRDLHGSEGSTGISWRCICGPLGAAQHGCWE